MLRFFLLASIVFWQSAAFSAGLVCPMIDKISQVFLSQHILYNSMNETLESHLVDQYTKRLDGAKIYLQKKDMDDVKKKMKGITAQVRGNKCSVLNDVQELLVKRVEERVAFAKSTMEAKNFKFDKTVELKLDPDTREYAKSKAELDKFHRKYLMFQLSNYLATGVDEKEARQQVVRNYERILKRVKEIKQDDLYASYLDAYGRALDPHSSYFSLDGYEDFEIQMGLELQGIGATLSSQDGFTVVEQLIEGGAAKLSGLVQPQDKIVAVGQFKANGETDEMKNVVEMDLRDVVKMIRGPKGTKVRLTLLRKSPEGKERITVTLLRDKIKLEDEAAALSWQERELGGVKKKVAVVNLPSFYADAKRGGRSSASDMKKLMAEAKKGGADAMVLDLSGNGGGSLDDAVRIAGLFFKTGNVVKQSSRDGGSELALADTDPNVDWDGPLVVLTSRVSASASEIVAGTLKDYGRAVIVGGDHTFGKGSVQSVVPLPGGLGAVKVTVGMFFTAGGKSTQHRGVAGDVVLPGAFSTDEFGERSLDYSLPPKEIKNFTSADAYVTEGAGAWKKVTAANIENLRKASEMRVSKNAEFQKIIAENKKLKVKGKVIKLSENLKDAKEKKDEAEQKKNLSKDARTVEYLKRPDIQEAINVVADLMSLQVSGKLAGAIN